MRLHMHSQFSLDSEPLIANGTLKWFLSCMPPYMLSQMRRVIKPLFAIFTLERFLSSVRPHMQAKISIFPVILAT